MDKAVLGVDTSTQSCTVVARRLSDGAVLKVATSPHSKTLPPVSEQHPNEWWSAFKSCLAQLDLENVCGLAVAGQGHGLVALDDKNAIIKVAKLWNDTTSSSQSTTIIQDLGSGYWSDKLGTLPLASFTITKLLWLQENEPENYQRLKTILLPHDYFNFMLTGVSSTDRSEASGTGFFDIRRNVFDKAILRDVGLENVDKFEFAKVLFADETAGNVTTTARKELNFANDLIVGSGANDNPASALAYGAINSGDLVISLGTSGTAFAPFETSIHDESGTIYGMAHTVSGYNPLVCTLNSTKVTDLFAKLLNVSLKELGELALSGSNRDNRPLLIPWIDGERTPSRPSERATLHEINNISSRSDIARAAFEGVIFGIVSAVEKFREFHIPIERLIVTGGGSNSPAYLQFLADAMQMPVHASKVVSAAASGIAIQAAALLKNVPVRDLVSEWAPKLEIVAKPRTNQNADRVMERFKQLVEL